MTTQYDILLTALNELIEINHSRINGYRKAADDIDGGDLKGLPDFMSLLNSQRASIAESLKVIQSLKSLEHDAKSE